MDSCFTPNSANMARGAYVLRDPHKGLADCVVFFYESEKEAVSSAAALLAVQGVALRLVQAVDMVLFAAQDNAYLARVTGNGIPLIAVMRDGRGSFAFDAVLKPAQPTELAAGIRNVVLGR